MDKAFEQKTATNFLHWLQLYIGVREKLIYFFFTPQVFIPNKTYSGQKLTKDVIEKMKAKTDNRIPTVPVTISVK